MIDTLRVEWHGLEWGPHVASWLLGEYRDAIAYAMSAGRLGAVKVAFDLRRLRA